jgi:hypothetical protein
VTISFGAPEWYRPLYKPLIEQFNTANADIQVQFVALDTVLANATNQANSPHDQMRRIVTAADTALISGKSAEDIEHGFFYDINPLMAADAAFDRDDFYSAAFGATR